jgi:hypothetical protein
MGYSDVLSLWRYIHLLAKSFYHEKGLIKRQDNPSRVLGAEDGIARR